MLTNVPLTLRGFRYLSDLLGYRDSDDGSARKLDRSRMRLRFECFRAFYLRGVWSRYQYEDAVMREVCWAAVHTDMVPAKSVEKLKQTHPAHMREAEGMISARGHYP